MLERLQSLQAVLLSIIAVASAAQAVNAFLPRPVIPTPTPTWEYMQLEVLAQFAAGVQQALAKDSTLSADNFNNRARSYRFDEAKLNELGGQGWELVGVLGADETVPFKTSSSVPNAPETWQTNVRPAGATLLFKRPLTE
ncbi:hypothetical protein [Deinococcus sp. SL84]|uniref:hypothetical protein n=1 Tax=Deinococcus sp. SL84 TaxID=2994663 RepID=UPI002272E2A4|nr:hypothetical protein [Deinococcus sp. SL84]MCY1701564.1 hypothetical protein [Deinococcus sp. SL84]